MLLGMRTGSIKHHILHAPPHAHLLSGITLFGAHTGGIKHYVLYAQPHAQLLSGSMLFGGLDYASVTHRVAFGPGANLRLTCQERAALGEDNTGTDRASAADTAAPDAQTPSPAAAAACGDADAVSPIGKAQPSGTHEDDSGRGGTGERVGPAGWHGGQLGDFVEWVLARDPASRPSWGQPLVKWCDQDKWYCAARVFVLLWNTCGPALHRGPIALHNFACHDQCTERQGKGYVAVLSDKDVGHYGSSAACVRLIMLHDRAASY
eukprot:1160117-Pelagomonas_calceolata.AAC.13